MNALQMGVSSSCSLRWRSISAGSASGVASSIAARVAVAASLPSRPRQPSTRLSCRPACAARPRARRSRRGPRGCSTRVRSAGPAAGGPHIRPHAGTRSTRRRRRTSRCSSAPFISGISCSSPTLRRPPSSQPLVVFEPNTRCVFAQPLAILRGRPMQSTWFDCSSPVSSSGQKRGTTRHDSENESGDAVSMRPSTKYSVFSVSS